MAGAGSSRKRSSRSTTRTGPLARRERRVTRAIGTNEWVETNNAVARVSGAGRLTDRTTIPVSRGTVRAARATGARRRFFRRSRRLKSWVLPSAADGHDLPARLAGPVLPAAALDAVHVK